MKQLILKEKESSATVGFYPKHSGVGILIPTEDFDMTREQVVELLEWLRDYVKHTG